MNYGIFIICGVEAIGWLICGPMRIESRRFRWVWLLGDYGSLLHFECTYRLVVVMGDGLLLLIIY